MGRSLVTGLLVQPFQLEYSCAPPGIARAFPKMGASPSTMRRAWHIQIALSVLLYCVSPVAVHAAEWHVADGGSGNGSAGAPFGRVQDALYAAQPGDSIAIGPGTFNERLVSVRGGTAAQPIRIYAAKGRGPTIVTRCSTAR